MKLLVSAALAIAAPAMAQNAGPAPLATVSEKAAAKAADDRKICRNDARTSTRLVKRTCRTAAEWHELDTRTDNNYDMSSKAK